ncbi:MAG: alpha/beta hydrolase [Burkholderiaceae bacterium]
MMLEIDGQPVFIYEGGRPRGSEAPTLVFIHGAQNDHSVWILQSRYLAHHGWRVLAVDLPGHGRSGGRPPASIDEAAQWVIRLLDATGSAKAALCGHSMGSLIALACAARAQGRTMGIALVGCAYPMRVSDALLEAAAHDEARAFEMILGWSNHGLHHPPGHPGPGFSIYHQNRRLMQRQAPGTLINDLRACNDWADGERAAAMVSAPVLFVSGAHDQMTPPRATETVAAVLAATDSRCPSVVRTVLDDCGHNLMAEQPAALLHSLRDWLAALPGAPAAA